MAITSDPFDTIPIKFFAILTFLAEEIPATAQRETFSVSQAVPAQSRERETTKPIVVSELYQFAKEVIEIVAPKPLCSLDSEVSQNWGLSSNRYCWRTSQLTASGEQRREMKQALTSFTKILTQVIHGKGELSMYYSEGVVAVVVVVANSINRLKAF